MIRALFAVVVSLLVVGCGGNDARESLEVVRVYWLSDGKVWPLARETSSEGRESQALALLFEGPTEEERDELGLSTAVPEPTGTYRLSAGQGVARYSGSPAFVEREAIAQLVYTLTQFPTVDSVEVEGEGYTRADFENLTPAILVESPLAFEEVGNPVRATGTANTFEANFHYELTDTDGRIVDEDFVTATSGSGERGTFDFTTAEYEIPFDGIGALIVFERSAEDGSRINLVEIPVRMSR